MLVQLIAKTRKRRLVLQTALKTVSETRAFDLIGMFDRAFVNQKQWSSSHGSLEQRSSCQQWLSIVRHYRSRNCTAPGGGGVQLAFDRWREYAFLWHLPSPSHLNQLFCNLHDLWIEFIACLERRLLKRRTTVALSDLASRTHARVESINLSQI